jgi:hypothetical protein
MNKRDIYALSMLHAAANHDIYALSILHVEAKEPKGMQKEIA